MANLGIETCWDAARSRRQRRQPFNHAYANGYHNDASGHGGKLIDIALADDKLSSWTQIDDPVRPNHQQRVDCPLLLWEILPAAIQLEFDGVEAFHAPGRRAEYPPRPLWPECV